MGNTTSLLSNYHIKEQLASDGRGNLNFILFKASLKINPQSHVSLFEYVLKQSDAPSLAFIKNAASKFKSIRHPGIIKYLTSQVMDSTVLFVTDYCIPLNQTLSRLPQEQVYLGLYGILDALDFLHSQQMVLNFCDLSTIYVSAGGLQFVMLETEMTESFLVFIKDNFTKDTIPPEDDNPALIQSYKLRDSYIIGQLISVIIEKFLNKPDLFFGWKNLEDVANEMTAMNPLKRPSIKNGLLESSFFIDNLFFQISTNLEKFKSFPAEKKDDMFNQLYSNLLLIPKSTVIEYILPVILQHELFSESTEPVFHKLFKLEEDGLLNPQEYQLLIVPFIKKSINSKEFYVRMGMLALLPIYLDTCLSFLDSTWFDSVLDQVLSGLEEADDDLYVQSFMSLIFLIPRYMKIYDSDSLKNSSLQNLSSPTAGSIGSLNSPQVSRISRLSVSLESTSATSKAEIKKSANKKAVLDLIVNRVLIPHFLNITCSEKFDSSCKCDVFIEIISLWKELHTKESVKSGMPFTKALMKSFHLVLKIATVEEKLSFLEAMSGSPDLDDQQELGMIIGLSGPFIIEFLTGLLTDASIKNFVVFKLHSIIDLMGTFPSEDTTTQSAELRLKMINLYSTKLVRNRQSVTKSGQPRLPISSEHSDRSSPVPSLSWSDGWHEDGEGGPVFELAKVSEVTGLKDIKKSSDPDLDVGMEAPVSLKSTGKID